MREASPNQYVSNVSKTNNNNYQVGYGERQ
jgi:hypothetical protein